MVCSHIHDFIRGTKIALPRPESGRSIDPSRWDIVRPNGSAERLVFHHLEALKALRAGKRRKMAKH